MLHKNPLFYTLCYKVFIFNTQNMLAFVIVKLQQYSQNLSMCFPQANKQKILAQDCKSWVLR